MNGQFLAAALPRARPVSAKAKCLKIAELGRRTRKKSLVCSLCAELVFVYQHFVVAEALAAQKWTKRAPGDEVWLTLRAAAVTARLTATMKTRWRLAAIQRQSQKIRAHSNTNTNKRATCARSLLSVQFTRTRASAHTHALILIRLLACLRAAAAVLRVCLRARTTLS